MHGKERSDLKGKSTESQVYKEGDNRITVEIPGVTDANEILKELGTPGSLEFLDSTGYTAFSQGNDYTGSIKMSGYELERNHANAVETTIEYKGKELVLNNLKLGKRDSKGTKVRV